MEQAVPAYGLYGERAGALFPDALHIETVTARSAVHDWRIRPHRHADLCQVFVLQSGGGVALLDGSRLPLRPPLVLLMPPLTVHGFVFEPGTDGHVVSIPTATLARTLGRDGTWRRAFAAPALLPLAGEAQASLAGLLALAAREFAGSHAGRDEALSCLAALVALASLRLLDGVPAGSVARADAQGELVRAFLAQVEADFRSQPPLAERARRLGVGVPHLSRACRALTGRSALALVQDRLLLEARRHLVYTSMTVQEIAYGIGFADPAYFTRFFTARAGLAPTAYRRSLFDGTGPARPPGAAGFR